MICPTSALNIVPSYIMVSLAPHHLESVSLGIMPPVNQTLVLLLPGQLPPAGASTIHALSLPTLPHGVSSRTPNSESLSGLVEATIPI